MSYFISCKTAIQWCINKVFDCQVSNQHQTQIKQLTSSLMSSNIFVSSPLDFLNKNSGIFDFQLFFSLECAGEWDCTNLDFSNNKTKMKLAYYTFRDFSNSRTQCWSISVYYHRWKWMMNKTVWHCIQQFLVLCLMNTLRAIYVLSYWLWLTLCGIIKYSLNNLHPMKHLKSKTSNRKSKTITISRISCGIAKPSKNYRRLFGIVENKTNLFGS